MNAISVMYVNQHLDLLRTEAQQHRAASLAERRSLRERIASATIGLRRNLGPDAGSQMPTLKNYPYGG